ncbi:hypothetical protein [Absidia glauca]|uniref:RNase H type-1 domain-containing protein n=1 Tax=Absidia glauca TaxID=4829 RepID=A0A168LSK5_ABSGL|nr:hypothetical protein [Absidia glauca]
MTSKHKIPHFDGNWEKFDWYCDRAGPRSDSAVVAILGEAMDEFEEYSSMSRQERKVLYRVRKHEHQLHYDRIVFTDGSVSALGNGGFGVFGGYEPEETVCGPIPFDQTSLNAELYAVYMALLYDVNVADAMRIESDCYGVVQALKRHSRHEGFVSQSAQLYHDLCRKILDVMAARPGPIGIGYVPGHSGIVGNVVADRLANSAGHRSSLCLP